jgi:two-component system, NtrC family, response regulator HydG
MSAEQQASILVVDDDHEMAEVVCDVLREAGYQAIGADLGAEALAIVKRECPDVLISDLRMSGLSGHQLQLELKRIAPNLPVIIITAFGSIQTAVESMKLGAFDYITKPFSNDELLLVVSRALEAFRLRQEVRRLRGELARSYGLPNIIATSPRMVAMLEMLKQVADSPASVLLTGESGTGKDLLARALHFESARHEGPFVPINCAALPEALIESELFGHVRGAFTDARQSRTGLIAAARGGTLFLDEIGEMPMGLQAKLLRVIEDKQVRPIGATEETPVDVRIVAATNADLERLMEQGRFRADLYYRLSALTLAVPPLRDRPEDFPLLLKHFLSRASAEAGKPPPEIDRDAIACMMRYRWPGNVRELHNVIQTAVIMCGDGKLGVEDLPPRIAGTGPSPGLTIADAVGRRLSLDRLEREYVRAIVGTVNGNKREAAAILQIDRKTLYRKLEEPEPAERAPLQDKPESQDTQDLVDKADKADNTN